jgi:hypothetical protein
MTGDVVDHTTAINADLSRVESAMMEGGRTEDEDFAKFRN